MACVGIMDATNISRRQALRPPLRSLLFAQQAAYHRDVDLLQWYHCLVLGSIFS